MATRKLTLEERFWSKVDRSGGPDACWPWTGYRRQNGYGQVCVDGRIEVAHRVAWQLANGPIPPETPNVLHHCDNPPCCNPYGTKHLFVGTKADNSADMLQKGRSPAGDRSGPRLHPGCMPRGEAHHNAKLTAEAIVAIRAAVVAGESQRSVAERYGIFQTTVSEIKRRVIWRHVP